MAKLVLIRHGESVWNEKNLWTGWQDIPLNDRGRQEANRAAEIINDIEFQMFFTSDLIRSIETLEIIKKALNLHYFPSVKHYALKERHYGEFTGKNKWQIQKKLGMKKFQKIRRGWNEAVKGGETLKMVYSRVVPYFKVAILPHLTEGKNILLVAHGNSIRALIKHLEGIMDKDIHLVEINTGEVIVYDVDKQGNIIKKEKRKNKGG